MRLNLILRKLNKSLGHLRIFLHYPRLRCRRIVLKTPKCLDNSRMQAFEVAKKKWWKRNNQSNSLTPTKSKNK